jgi:hypothetical protein
MKKSNEPKNEGLFEYEKVEQELRKQIEELKLRKDSYRKSAEYYKRERETTKGLLVKVSNELEDLKEESKNESEFLRAKADEWRYKYFDEKEEWKRGMKGLRGYITLLTSALGLALLGLAFS